jgi:hypothetical protein
MSSASGGCGVCVWIYRERRSSGEAVGNAR